MEAEKILTYFNSHNRSRIERLCELAPQQHQLLFQLLPLIFHSNDSGLPCYVENAPFGIVDYQPSDALLATAKKFNHSFSYSKHAFPQYPIQGLYLINDNGVLSYAKNPRFTLWLVYSSFNSDDNAALLKKKLHAVITLAKSFGITLNARLLNDTAVKEYKIETNDLDRLYSSGLILAGCVPLWWFVEPEHDHDYALHAKQLSTSLPNHINTLDFGPLGTRSAASLVNSASQASLEAMKHGLPYYLELFYQKMLIEHLSDNLWLAPRYKQAIYNQEANSFLCEPYMLKFEMVSETLPYDLTDVLRRSIYLLCEERLSLTVKSPKHPWRRDNLLDLVSDWHWDRDELAELDQRNQATIRIRLNEFTLTQKFTRQLNDAIASLVKSSVPDARANVLALNKAYQEIFDPAHDVIPCLPKDLIPEIAEDNLFLEHDSNTHTWIISEVDKSTLKKGELFSALYSNESLLQTCAWAIINGALAKYTRLKILPNNTEVSNQTIHGLLEHLLKSPLISKTPSEESPLNWLMFANIEQTPKEAYQQQDMKLALHLRDPLNYSYHRRNMIIKLDVLASYDNSSWHYMQYDEATATGEVLASLIRWQTSNEQNNYIDCWCPTPHFASSINKRLVTLAENVCAHFKKSPNNGTYILEVADRLNHLQWQQQNVDATLISNRYNLSTLLSQPRTTFSATLIDDHIEQEALYNLLLKEQDKGQLRFFMNVKKTELDIYILDELGHLFTQSISGQRENTLLSNYNHFLSYIAQVNKLSEPKFFKLHHKIDSWSLKSIIPPQTVANDFLSIKVKMADAKPDSECSILCGSKIFSGKANETQLFQQVYQLVIQLRKSKGSYPIYVSDIIFTSNKNYSSYHYITYKQRFELVLNAK